jgi:type II secretory pathway pseudopilin PulG
LLEVMIVLALISLIAGTVGVVVFNRYRTGLVKVAKINVSEISNAVVQYMIDNDSNCPQGMDDLAAKKHLKKAMKDPWGRPFSIVCPGQKDPDSADVTSSGPDKQAGNADDINSWD